MSNKYKFAGNEKMYFINFSVVYWIDLFIGNAYKEVVLESWRCSQKEKDLEISGR